MHYKKGSGAPSYVEAGTYPFEVVEAKNTTSKKSNNDMIELTLELSTGTKVLDYLVDNERSIWKIDEFIDATELVIVGDELDASDCLGATGRVKVRVGETDQGRNRNEVVQYLPKEVIRPTRTVTTPPAKPTKAPTQTTEPDDIPF